MGTTLVTGATGLVGFHVVQSLLMRGRHVRVLVRSIDKGKALLPAECKLVQGDVTDPAAVRRAMQGCAVVYHVAGIPEQSLLAKGGFLFMEWQAHPLSDKAQRELGWDPTPLREGIRQTIAFLNEKKS